MPSATNLTQLIDKVIEAEGTEYTNHPADRGGPTKFGITLKTLRALPGYTDADAEDVHFLTRERAVEIYKNIYAAPFMFINDDKVFNFLFNGAIQHGVHGMIKIMQRALGTPDDGVMGLQTRHKLTTAAVNPQYLLAALVAERCKYYANIMQKDHSQRVFAAGWLNRLAHDLS